MQRLQDDTAAVPCYDSDTVRAVLARASQIEQQAEAESLTAAQVETLGRELGLSPTAVRRALGELYPQVTTVAPRKKLSAAQMYSTMLPGLVYASIVASLFFFAYPSITSGSNYEVFIPFLIATVFVMPPLSSFWFGWRSGDLRLGGVTGEFLSLFAGLAPGIGITLAEGRFRYGSQEILLISVAVIFGTAFGALGGWLRERYDREQSAKAR